MDARQLKIVMAAAAACAAGSVFAQVSNEGAPRSASNSPTDVSVPAQQLPTPGNNGAATSQTSSSGAMPVVQAQSSEPEKAGASQLAEVVVTANKRKESTRTVAGGVTAVTREQLDQAGASNLNEYLSLSPGVNFDDGVPGYSVVTIRGISSDTVPGLAQTAVGMYYDDIPLTDPGAPLVVPDIDAFDASRIEVLRGPQGALYGSASLGGAINYIPSSPDPNNAEFAVAASGDRIICGPWGWSGKAMINAPLFGSGTALRLVGYNIDQPGYVDNVGTNTPNSNNSAIRGGRASFGWNITPDSTLRLSAIYQRTTVADQGYVNPALPGYEKSTIVAEPSNNSIWLVDSHYELKTDFATLQVIGGYQEKSSYISYDGASALGLGALGLQLPLTDPGRTRGYSAELRLVSPQSETFNWLAGAAYVYHHEEFSNNLDAKDLQTVDTFLGLLGLPLPPQISSATHLFDESVVLRAPEEAIYADASYRFFKYFKLSAGGRFYRNMVNSATASQGLLLAPALTTQTTAQNSQKGEGFNPRLSLSYDLTPGIMLYTTYSKGYRLGGPNLVPSTPLSQDPASYNPDRVRNIEVGLKSRWWHGHLTAEVAAYDIGWNGIPLLVEDSSGLFKYLKNAGEARSKGIESSLAIRALSFLTFRSAITYGDGRLKAEFNPNNGRPAAPAGSQLPGSPNWTVTNSLIGEWEWAGFNPTLAFIHRYVGSSPANISYEDVRVGNYNLLDVRAGLTVKGLTVTAFGKNITNTYARSAINIQQQANLSDLELTFLSPPRTLGVEASYHFGE